MRSFALFVLSVGCSLGGQNFDVVQSNQPRDTSPSSSDVPELANDNLAFATDVYKQIATDDSSNLFYSPYSISLALAMTYNGANGETAQQMAQALHFTLPVDHLNAAFDSVDLALSSRKNAVDDLGNAVKGFELNVADSLWADKTLTMQQPFVDSLGVSYGAGVRLVDFVNAADPARDAINGWVSQETNAKIPNLLPEGSVDSSTRLVLVNAIYFDAAWATPFQTSATHAEAFTKLDGTTATSNGMNQALDSANYSKGSGWQAVELPYVGNQTSMVVLVPDQGQIANVEHGLSGDFITSVTSGLAATPVNVTLPKFQIHGATISLKQTLQALRDGRRVRWQRRFFEDGERAALVRRLFATSVCRRRRIRNGSGRGDGRHDESGRGRTRATRRARCESSVRVFDPRHSDEHRFVRRSRGGPELDRNYFTTMVVFGADTSRSVPSKTSTSGIATRTVYVPFESDPFGERG